MTKWERRQRRESQQKYRKLGPSPATILENTQVVMCVKCGTMTEEKGAKTLRVGLEEFRDIRQSVVVLARSVAGKLSED